MTFRVRPGPEVLASTVLPDLFVVGLKPEMANLENKKRNNRKVNHHPSGITAFTCAFRRNSVSEREIQPRPNS